LNSKFVKVTRIAELSDSAKQQAFSKKFASDKTLQLFTRKISEKNLEFAMNSVPLQKDRTRHKVYLCDVAVGKTIFASKESAMNYFPPQEFDTFICPRGRKDLEKIIDEETTTDGYEYVVKEKARVMGRLEIEFDYDASFSIPDGVCEMCLEQQAVMFCLAERANFCRECDERTHANYFTRRHTKFYFQEIGAINFLICEEHPEDVAEYFCEECLSPVCTKCMIMGSHASSDHKIDPFVTAASLNKINFDASSFKKNRAGVAAGINELKAEVAKFKENYVEIVTKIENEHRAAVNELKVWTAQNYQVYSARYLEMLRFQNHLESIQSFTERLNSSEVLQSFREISETVENLCLDIPESIKHSKVSVQGKLTLIENSPKFADRVKLKGGYLDVEGSFSENVDINSNMSTPEVKSEGKYRR